MTPNERTDAGPTPSSANTAASLSGVKAASTVALLAGIWLFVSPWIYGAYTNGDAWNSWIVGAAIFIVGCFRIWTPVRTAGLSWVNALLGAWTFCSPWIYGYTAKTGRFINSLCVGVVVFFFSVFSARGAARATAPPPPKQL